MFIPDCTTCRGEGVLAASECTDCHGTGEINRWRECTASEYAAAIASAGGLQALGVMSSYTRTESDAWGTGRLLQTTWGLGDEPVVHHEDREHEHRYWLWAGGKGASG